jgi:predicted Rossmann-fold nucleotide-binding protein
MGLQSGVCILYNLEGFYDPLKSQFSRMVEEGFIDREAMKSIFFTENLQEITSIIEDYSERSGIQ